MSSTTPKVRISLACVACKKRKAKCSGGPPPCQSCKTSGTRCIIDESLDGRRKAAAKRTFDELTYHKTFIEDLLTFVRVFDQTSLEQLITLIKADVPLQEIGALIDESLQLARQGSDSEDSLRDLRLDGSISRNIRRKIEAQRVNSPQKSNATRPGKTSNFENQASTISEQERVLSFLEHTTHDEIGSILKILQSSQTKPLYDGLLEYISTPEQRGATDVASPPLEDHIIAAMGIMNLEFRKARTLSVPNLFEYQQYIQSLFSAYPPSELLANPPTDGAGRMDWHPALKWGSSSSSVDSDENANDTEPVVENSLSQESSVRGLLSSRMLKDEARTGQSENTSTPVSKAKQIRLTLRNDPKGKAFVISPPAPQDLMNGQCSLPSSRRTNSVKPGSWSIEQRMAKLNIPLYQVLPLTGIDDSPLARSYTSYRDEARTMLLEGCGIDSLYGIPRTVVNLLLRPRRRSDAHSICNWACELSGAFRNDFDTPWIMACSMLLSRFMKWLLVPTEESYNDIPVMMRPTPNQRFIPHNPVADLLPIPALRDALCIRFRDYVTPMSNSCRFNWPHSIKDAVEHDEAADTYYLTKEFEDWAEDETNWAVSRSLIDSFPEIADHNEVIFYD